MNSDEFYSNTVRLVGGQHTCNKCGKTTFGSIEHICEEDKMPIKTISGVKPNFLEEFNKDRGYK